MFIPRREQRRLCEAVGEGGLIEGQVLAIRLTGGAAELTGVLF
jgi:hypothetical protein